MNLVEDILVEILSRLPVRSLIRFKCVSKTWLTLISSSSFAQMHLALQLTKDDEHIQLVQCLNETGTNVVRRFDSLESLSELTLPPSFDLPGYEKGGIDLVHLNGIICINDHDFKITLWNPAMGEFRMLPTRPNCFTTSDYTSSLVLGIGFGYDDAMNDYKVVCVQQLVKEVVGPTIEMVQVYNLKTDSWRTLETMPDDLLVPEHGVCPLSTPVFFKGSVHWAVCGINRQVILTFNMTTELFNEFQCPHIYRLLQISCIFLLDKSTLSLVVYFPSDTRFTCQQIDVWMLEDYSDKDSWIKQHVITSTPEFLFPLCFWKKDKFILLNSDGVLVCYDLPTGQQHHLQEYYTSIYISSFQAVVYIETLVSIW